MSETSPRPVLIQVGPEEIDLIVKLGREADLGRASEPAEVAVLARLAANLVMGLRAALDARMGDAGETVH